MAELSTSEIKPPALLNDGLLPFPVEQPEPFVPPPAERIVFVTIDVDEYVSAPIPEPPAPQTFDWRTAAADIRRRFAIDRRRGILLTSIALGSAAFTAAGIRSYYVSNQAGVLALGAGAAEIRRPVDVVSRDTSMLLPATSEAPVQAPPEVTAAPANAPSSTISIEKSTPRVQSAPERRAPAGAPRTYRGHLIIDSVPQGAAVLINQQQVGVTPLDLPQHPSGSYAIWIQREGFQRWTKGVLVTASQTTRVMAKLESSR